MKRRAIFAVFAATIFCGMPAAAAPRSERDEAFERKIEAELRARDATAADEFAEATAAADRGDFDGAATGFEHVRTAAPWFVHATRRLCGVEVERGNRDHAVALCREAVGADPSPENETALALALVQSKGARSEADGQEALRLARDASFKQEQTKPFTQLVLCQCALAQHDLETLAICADRLKSVAPHEMAAQYFAAIADATRGRTEDADRELEAAHAQGLPDRVYNELRQGIEDSRPPLERWGHIALRWFVAWLAGLALLLGGGALLSVATLRSVARMPTEANGRASGFDAGLRHTYRLVLWVTCAYYYASLPVVALLVVTMGAGVVYACVAMGQIPIKLVLIAAILVLGSLGSIAKSLFVRARDEEPGEKLDLAENPKLCAVLHEVAGRIGTRPVDSVYLTPSTEVAVLERGGMLKQVSGKSERCLVLGAAVLDEMRVRELKAILAHEYGHFRNEDTAGGGFALAVRRSILTMAMHLVRNRAASRLNPAWWFVNGFYSIFLRVSQGASRLQEVLADRWAAFAYGSEAFAHGLRHVVERSVRFDAHLRATLDEIVPKKEPLTNVYAFVPKEPVAPDKRSKRP